MSFEKFQQNREVLRGVGKVEKNERYAEVLAQVPIPRDADEEVLHDSGRFTEEEIMARRKILDNAVGALYPLSTTLRHLMRRVEDTLSEHNRNAVPIPRDVTEKALQASGFTDKEIQRHREIADRSALGQVKALVQDEQFLQRVKNALRRAEEFKSVRGRFETTADYKNWITQTIVTDQEKYDKLNFLQKKFASPPNNAEYADAGNMLWNGYPRARTENATRLAVKLLERMEKDPALSATFDPLGDKSPPPTATT